MGERKDEPGPQVRIANTLAINLILGTSQQQRALRCDLKRDPYDLLVAPVAQVRPELVVGKKRNRKFTFWTFPIRCVTSQRRETTHLKLVAYPNAHRAETTQASVVGMPRITKHTNSPGLLVHLRWPADLYTLRW